MAEEFSVQPKTPIELKGSLRRNAALEIGFPACGKLRGTIERSMVSRLLPSTSLLEKTLQSSCSLRTGYRAALRRLV